MSRPAPAPAQRAATPMPAAVQRPEREVWIRVTRASYLTSTVEAALIEGDRVISRRVLHPADMPRIALAKAYEALERMVEDR